MSFELRPLNKVALVSFLIAKVLGIVGVGLGFVSGLYGAAVLLMTLAGLSILVSIGCSVTQMFLDRNGLEKEDRIKSEVRRLEEVQFELQRKVEELEERRSSLEKVRIRMGA